MPYRVKKKPSLTSRSSSNPTLPTSTLLKRLTLGLVYLALYFQVTATNYAAAAGTNATSSNLQSSLTVGSGSQVCSEVFAKEVKLIKDAHKLKLVPYIAPVAYRFDSRAPTEIKAAGGFLPNPHKKPGSIYDHVNPRSNGSASYVSLTLGEGHSDAFRIAVVLPRIVVNQIDDKKAENEFLKLKDENHLIELQNLRKRLSRQMLDILNDPRVFDREHPTRILKFWVLPRETKAKLLSLRAEFFAVSSQLDFSKSLSSRNPTIYILFEYRVADVYGVEPKKFGIEEEREFVTPQVVNQQISHYRKVYIVDLRARKNFLNQSVDQYGVNYNLINQLYEYPDSMLILNGEWTAF